MSPRELKNRMPDVKGAITRKKCAVIADTPPTYFEDSGGDTVKSRKEKPKLLNIDDSSMLDKFGNSLTAPSLLPTMSPSQMLTQKKTVLFKESKVSTSGPKDSTQSLPTKPILKN